MSELAPDNLLDEAYQCPAPPMTNWAAMDCLLIDVDDPDEAREFRGYGKKWQVPYLGKPLREGED